MTKALQTAADGAYVPGPVMTLRASIVSAFASLPCLTLVAALACGPEEGSSSGLTLTATFTATAVTNATNATNATASATTMETATTAETGAMTTGTSEATPTTSGGTDSDPDPTADPSAGSTTDSGSSGSFCVHQCASDVDCRVDGKDVGLACKDSLCTGGSTQCTNNAECVALYSGWTATPCTSGGGECGGLLQHCVRLPDGTGGCAYVPGDFFTCDSVAGWVELTVPDIDGNPVTVCGNPKAECNEQGICFVGCDSNADCVSEAYPVCNPQTRQCGCGSDDHCATLGLPYLSACHDGVCGCAIDAHCVDAAQGDVCKEGRCQCSGDAACVNYSHGYDGGTVVCREF